MDEKETAEASWDELTIVRIDGSRRYKRTDRLIKEEAYRLRVNGNLVHTFACTPIDLEELAIGYAFAEGYIADAGDIQSLAVDSAEREIRLSIEKTGAPLNGDSPQKKPGASSLEDDSFSHFSHFSSFSKEAIYTLWETFNQRCSLFHITGAVHGMALTDGSGILALHEDAARHNAAAKTIGEMVRKGISPEGKAFIFSGRLALKIVMMIERTGVKVLLCHGAGTSDAVRRAESAGITLAGFVRRGYMNIYTHSQRITEA
ncbi:MAG: formate dehydrogenase accessory sulfurtransferase FdhD [Spirochaetaceae bacterium]|jgi:FdhD protein|nr:formate dehydrogenase accessory sulfurtransferase FdhD [Spirochaetaceae bacterium]